MLAIQIKGATASHIAGFDANIFAGRPVGSATSKTTGRDPQFTGPEL